MSSIELLTELRRRGIKILCDGDVLRIRGQNDQLTPSLRQRLLEQKSDIIALFTRLNETGVEDPIPVVPRSSNLPLSFAQERMWLLEQIEGAGNTRNMPVVLRLQGVLDVAALERAVAGLVGRHEVLRTRIATADGDAVQLIGDGAGIGLGRDDLDGLERREEIEGRVRRIVSGEVSRAFDLSGEAPFRARLVRLGDDDHVLVVVVHHIASDGWSMGLLLRELGALYGAFTAGQASPLPPLAIQYADYAVWQRGFLSGERLERQLGYWRE
ncbi:condensation domain-containing protein, partial [Bradyrhizobium sp. SHOUNA76]|uniref:condensation domain-containing protein n=1 Tax=Bradyrhizobium sp. SHOUNA76 TaxID=2908927 RepID=UPI001FF31379